MNFTSAVLLCFLVFVVAALLGEVWDLRQQLGESQHQLESARARIAHAEREADQARHFVRLSHHHTAPPVAPDPEAVEAGTVTPIFRPHRRNP